jgi:hypothetical protein
LTGKAVSLDEFWETPSIGKNLIRSANKASFETISEVHDDNDTRYEFKREFLETKSENKRL